MWLKANLSHWSADSTQWFPSSWEWALVAGDRCTQLPARAGHKSWRDRNRPLTVPYSLVGPQGPCTADAQKTSGQRTEYINKVINLSATRLSITACHSLRIWGRTWSRRSAAWCWARVQVWWLTVQCSFYHHYGGAGVGPAPTRPLLCAKWSPHTRWISTYFLKLTFTEN